MFGRLGRTTRFIVFTGFLMALGVLSFADRAPDQARGGLRASRDIGRWGERATGIDVFDLSDIPLEWDTVGHVLMWFAAAILASAAFGRLLRHATIGFLLVSLSAGIEIGQHFLSSSRSPTLSDLIANIVGVVAGLTCVAFLPRLAHYIRDRSPSLAR